MSSNKGMEGNGEGEPTVRRTIHTRVETVAIDPEKAENMSEINEKLREGGILARPAEAMAEYLLGEGHEIAITQAIAAVEAAEAASWRAWDGMYRVYGLALWPCGHVQAVNLGGRSTNWVPEPSHYRPLYVPPGLVTGARTKPLAGSVVSRPWRGVPVQGGTE